MSMISELVKELREHADIWKQYTSRENTVIELLEKAADTIESLSAKLQAADSGGGWIPCSERLPEIMKPVLVCDKQGNICVRAITCKIKGKKFWSQGKNDVVAWQPLPEPYHEP